MAFCLSFLACSSESISASSSFGADYRSFNINSLAIASVLSKYLLISPPSKYLNILLRSGLVLFTPRYHSSPHGPLAYAKRYLVKENSLIQEDVNCLVFFGSYMLRDQTPIHEETDAAHVARLNLRE